MNPSMIRTPTGTIEQRDYEFPKHWKQKNLCSICKRPRADGSASFCKECYGLNALEKYHKKALTRILKMIAVRKAYGELGGSIEYHEENEKAG